MVHTIWEEEAPRCCPYCSICSWQTYLFWEICPLHLMHWQSCRGGPRGEGCWGGGADVSSSEEEEESEITDEEEEDISEVTLTTYNNHHQINHNSRAQNNISRKSRSMQENNHRPLVYHETLDLKEMHTFLGSGLSNANRSFGSNNMNRI